MTALIAILAGCRPDKPAAAPAKPDSAATAEPAGEPAGEPVVDTAVAEEAATETEDSGHEIFDEPPDQPYTERRLDDLDAFERVTGTRDFRALFEKLIGPQIRVVDPDNPTHFAVGDFNGDGIQDAALTMTIAEGVVLRFRPGMLAYRPPEDSSDWTPETDSLAFPGDESSGSFLAIAHGVHGGWDPGLPRDIHLLHNQLPVHIYEWTPDPPGWKAGWLKGASIATTGEGSGDGYYWFDGTRYRYKLTMGSGC